MANDPRRGHPDFTPSEAPAPEKRMMGVRVPPVKIPQEETPEEPGPMPPVVEKVPVEHSEQKLVTPSQDPWVQRIAAATVLVGAISAAGWGGVKISERDMPSSEKAGELTAAMDRTEKALNSHQREVAKLHKIIEAAEARDKEQTKTIELQEKKILAHAHTIYLLNGSVSPIYGWPEPRLGDWTPGTDNLHRHNRRGGQYPGSE